MMIDDINVIRRHIHILSFLHTSIKHRDIKPFSEFEFGVNSVAGIYILMQNLYISIQRGPNHYCDLFGRYNDYDDLLVQLIEENVPHTYEVAFLDKDLNITIPEFLKDRFKYDDVLGYQTKVAIIRLVHDLLNSEEENW